MNKPKKFFGTDGIRGIANKADMNANIALKLGMAAGSILRRGHHQHRVIIGKDTRLSGYLIEQSITAGFISVGMDVILVGPMPTPAIAMLTRSMRADIGVMITASHNPYIYNGIKLFGHDGYKLPNPIEHAIEERMNIENSSIFLVEPEQLGRAKRLDDAQGRYVEFVKNSFPKKKNLEGLKIVLDCAHGAAYHLGPTIFWELGAEVIVIGNTPDGLNINKEYGSTSPNHLITKVLEHNADIGIALDGDGDRLLIVDEKGKIINGDQIIAIIAHYLHNKQAIKGGGVVTTLMSNLGLEKYLASLGLNLIRAQVGDRYVVEEMRKHNINLGGEQSGHIILGDYSTTGDGLIAGLHVLAAMICKGQPISEVAKLFDPLPQVVRNLDISSYVINSQKEEKIKQLVKTVQQQLPQGRILIRNSGTEPLMRVMVEGENEKEINQLADEIVDLLINILS